MSSLEDIISGWNDVNQRIIKATENKEQVISTLRLNRIVENSLSFTCNFV